MAVHPSKLYASLAENISSFARQNNTWLLPTALLCMSGLYASYALFYQNGPHGHPRWIRELFLWGTLSFQSLLYILGGLCLHQKDASLFQTPQKKRFLLGLLMGCFLLNCLFVWLTSPFHSTDLGGYINRGWEQWHYDLNPYVTIIDEIPNWQADPMIRNHWVNNPCPYGFVFAQLAKGICALGGGNWYLTRALFKASNIIALIGTLLCLGFLLKQLGKSITPIYWLAFSPLILLQQIANGHNDLWMTCFGLCALTLLKGRQSWLALTALVLAILTKYAALIMLPFLLLWLWYNTSRGTLFLNLVFAGMACFFFSIPYLNQWENIRWEGIQENATLVHNSLIASIYHFYELLANWIGFLPNPTVFKQPLKLGLTLLLLLAFVRRCVLILRAGHYTFEALLWDTTFFHWLLITIVSAKFYPWYLAMVFPYALLLSPREFLWQICFITSLTELLAFTFLGQAHIVNYLLLMGLPLLCLRERLAHSIAFYFLGKPVARY